MLISQLLYIESLKFLYLPHIIRGVLCGVDTGILKIRCKEAEIWAKQKFKCQVYLSTPFSLFESSFLKIHWFWRFGIKIKKTGATTGVKGFFSHFFVQLGTKLITKIGLNHHHHPPPPPPPGTFQREGPLGPKDFLTFFLSSKILGENFLIHKICWTYFFLPLTEIKA